MLYAVQMDHGVPAIRALSQLTVVQITEVQADPRLRTRERRRPYWKHRRQNLWRPENGLFEEGLIRISREKPTPSDAGIPGLRSVGAILSRYRSESRDRGADIPTQIR